MDTKPTTKPTTKTWIMLTRYHKDIHGEQHSLTSRYASPLIAQSVFNLWTITHGQETDFKVFLNLITLWKGLEIIDIDDLTESDLMRRANEESFGVNRLALEQMPIIDPISLPHLCD